MEDCALADSPCAPCRRLLQGGRKIGYAPQYYLDNEKGTVRLPTDEETEVEQTLHHADFRAFSASAAAGCHVCALLLSQLTADEQRQMLPYEQESYARLDHSWRREVEGETQFEIWVTYCMPPKGL